MFDLEQQIAAWRSTLLQNESVSSSEVDELECHLRDTVDEFGQLALPAEDAFWLAARRLGSPEALALEFTKINGARTWSRRAQWMLAGYLILSLIVSTMAFLGNLISLTAIHFEVPFHLAIILSSLSIVATLVALILGVRNLAGGESIGLQPLASKFAVVARSKRRWWLVALPVVFFLAMSVMRIGTGMVFTRVMPASRFGVAAVVQSSNAWFGHLLVLSTIVGLLCWLVGREASVGPRSGASNSRLIMGMVVMSVLLLCAFGMMSLGLEAMYGASIVNYTTQ